MKTNLGKTSEEIYGKPTIVTTRFDMDRAKLRVGLKLMISQFPIPELLKYVTSELNKYSIHDYEDYYTFCSNLADFITLQPQTAELELAKNCLFNISSDFKDYWDRNSKKIEKEIKEFSISTSELQSPELVRYINENPINFNGNSLDMNWQNLVEFIIAQPESAELDKDISLLLKNFPSFCNFCYRKYPKLYSDAKKKTEVVHTPEQIEQHRLEALENKKFREYMNAKVAANRIQDQIARQAAAVQKH